MNKLVICFMGPTASGKTDLALQLAEIFPLEIVSVDSVMIYRGMDIGSAKPSQTILAQLPHHLIDIVNPDETYSVGRFVGEACYWIQDIHQRGKIPLLVGGTMLYFHALQQGLASLPEADRAVRADIEAQAAQFGWENLHQQLLKVDPISAAHIRPQDRQRISRALEVYQQTGQPLSTLLKTQKTTSLDWQWLNLILYPSSRPWLHERINQRFMHMLSNGLIDEVKQLMTLFPESIHSQAMRAVGYRQVLAYLNGHLDRTHLVEKGMAATRQLAKRQCTWLKSWPHAHDFDPQEKDILTLLSREVNRLLS